MRVQPRDAGRAGPAMPRGRAVSDAGPHAGAGSHWPPVTLGRVAFAGAGSHRPPRAREPRRRGPLCPPAAAAARFAARAPRDCTRTYRAPEGQGTGRVTGAASGSWSRRRRSSSDKRLPGPQEFPGARPMPCRSSKSLLERDPCPWRPMQESRGAQERGQALLPPCSHREWKQLGVTDRLGASRRSVAARGRLGFSAAH